MTLQEIYSKVRKHLLTQNGKSLMEGKKTLPICAYRGDNEKTCAVGCLIKDEFYTPDIEGTTIVMQIWTPGATNDHAPFPLNRALFNSIGHLPEDGAKLLRILRMIHDHKFPEDWEKSLNDCADMFKLDAAA